MVRTGARATLVFVAVVIVVACSAAPSTSPPATSPPDQQVAASTSPGATATSVDQAPTPTPINLATTTVPAKVAPTGSITVLLTNFQFRPSRLTAKAGTVVFFLKNVRIDQFEDVHDLAIGPVLGTTYAQSNMVDAGTSAVFTVEGLMPGTYVIWCTQQGHVDFGMTGTLVVAP